MAPKNKKKKQAETVDLREQQPRAPLGSHLSITRPPTRSPQATLLTLTGLAVAAFGCFLSLGPSISPQAERVVQGLAGLGVHGGVLFVGGLMLVGMGMLRRGQVTLADIARTAVDPGLVEDMASDIVRLGAAFDRSTGMLDSLQDGLAGVRTVVENPPMPPAPPPPPVQDNTGFEDAIFRMAASLDKVGAKIEERLKSQFAELQTRIASVEASMAKAEEGVNRLADRTVRGPDVGPVHHTVADVAGQPALEHTGIGAAAGTSPDHAEGSLGVLDDIHDPVTAPLPATPSVDFDQADSLRLSDVQPAPGQGTWDEGPAGPNPQANLRSALEDMRRTGDQPPPG